MKNVAFLLLLRYVTMGILYGCTLFSRVTCQSCSVITDSTCFDLDYCQTGSDGINGLECYKQYLENHLTCTWKPGTRASNATTYTLITEQIDRSKCKRCKNILNTFHLIEGLFSKNSVTIWVVESDPNRNCSKAIFKGTPNQLVRCPPPSQISYTRGQGKLHISWKKGKNALQYLVQFRESNMVTWKTVKSDNNHEVTVSGLNRSVSYAAQVQCNPNSTSKRCQKCMWSDVLFIPPELTEVPNIVEFITELLPSGKQRFHMSWKYNSNVSGYSVTVKEESGEFQETFNTTLPEISLTLSLSAYLVRVVAFNSGGQSPAYQRKIPEPQNIDLPGQINVSACSNESFSISWNKSLVKNYTCYSVVWGLVHGNKTSQSFHSLSEKISLRGTLEPYKIYRFILHLRHNKSPCNLKSLNNSESTYGRADAYCVEGRPKSGPVNVTYSNVTKTSAVINWSKVREEDLQGFLQGYIIHYRANDTSASSAITVNSSTNSYILTKLKSKTIYKVSVSAFTTAGEGVRSDQIIFETKQYELSNIIVIVVCVISGILLSLCAVPISSRAFKRAKIFFWPNIPNPGNSNAMQEIDRSSPLEFSHTTAVPLFEADTDEKDADSLHIIEESSVMLAEIEQLQNEPVQSNVDPSPTKPAPPPVSDYTTMEFFHQVMPHASIATAVAQVQPGRQNDIELSTMATLKGMTALDYLKQTLCNVYSNTTTAGNDTIETVM
ncbi:interleukin-31 receptor subunit alpha-like [Acipenser ruthenus]|uniref:interleukin-31 receptor subunit alpha-like n=1 Tax=Acipenser ruthenus TaxID=7906 RepID=UPI00145A47E1|nr:interleukin-31 receptor subunit alpha-like [Acipenser ruthenus]